MFQYNVGAEFYMLDERDHAREKAEANAREQSELDRIAAMRFSTGGAHA